MNELGNGKKTENIKTIDSNNNKLDILDNVQDFISVIKNNDNKGFFPSYCYGGNDETKEKLEFINVFINIRFFYKIDSLLYFADSSPDCKYPYYKDLQFLKIYTTRVIGCAKTGEKFIKAFETDENHSNHGEEEAKKTREKYCDLVKEYLYDRVLIKQEEIIKNAPSKEYLESEKKRSLSEEELAALMGE